MSRKLNRRALSIGAAIGLTLGGGAIAVASTPILPDAAADQARSAVISPAAPPQDAGQPTDLPTDGDGENAEAFAAWAQSVPKDWGCIRGLLISHAARGDHRGDFTGPGHASAQEAADGLGIGDLHCAQVAIDGEAAANGAGDGEGPPEHVPGPPEDVDGPPEGVDGPPEHVPGPSDDVDGPPEHVPGPPEQP